MLIFCIRGVDVKTIQSEIESGNRKTMECVYLHYTSSAIVDALPGA